LERPGGQGDDLLGVGDLAEDGSLEEEGGADEVGSAARALAEPWIGAAAAALLDDHGGPVGVFGGRAGQEQVELGREVVEDRPSRAAGVPVAASVERFAAALGGPAAAASARGGGRRRPPPAPAGQRGAERGPRIPDLMGLIVTWLRRALPPGRG
jgi:hypothetical protein